MNTPQSFQPAQLHWQYLLRVRRNMAGALLFFVLSAVLGAFLFFSVWPKLLSSRQAVVAAQKSLENTQQKHILLQGSAFLDEAQTRQQIDTLLPSKKPLIQLLSNLAQAAQSAQVVVTEIETSPGRIASGSAQLQTNVKRYEAETEVTNIRGTDVLTIGMTVTGSLSQVNQFVKNIELITPLSDITHLELMKASSEDVSGAGLEAPYQAKLSIASYFSQRLPQLDTEAPLPSMPADADTLLQALSSFQFLPETEQTAIQGGGLEDLFQVSQGEEVTPQ